MGAGEKPKYVAADRADVANLEQVLPNSFDPLSPRYGNATRIDASLSACPALVLAGGLGTRLREVYSDGPKCMAPVAGRPFLEYLLASLRSAGIKDVILCVGYKSDQVRRWIGNGSKWEIRVRYSVEKELRGTAGAVRLAARLVKAQRYIVLNGDSFLEVDLGEMLKFHHSENALATLALARVPDAGRYGGVRLRRDGRISAFTEKGETKPASSRSKSQLINGGVYVLQRRFIESIPSGKPVSLEKESFPRMVGGKLYGFVTRGFFIDIGVPLDYTRAQTEFVGRLDESRLS